MMRALASAFVVALCCAAASVSAQSSALPDPTRPPPGVQADAEQTFGDSTAGPLLQSVMTPKKGKPSALISGKIVTLGGVLGDSRLIALSEKEAVLEGPGGVERLLLTPNVEKNLVPKTTAPRRSQSKGNP